MRRWLIGSSTCVAFAVAAWYGWSWLQRVERPIRVGILHSLSGPLKISEASMRDAEVMALEQVNADGGLLGRKVEWVIADGRSDPDVFAQEARRLIETEKVSAIFGCWSAHPAGASSRLWNRPGICSSLPRITKDWI